MKNKRIINFGFAVLLCAAQCVSAQDTGASANVFMTQEQLITIMQSMTNNINQLTGKKIPVPVYIAAVGTLGICGTAYGTRWLCRRFKESIEEAKEAVAGALPANRRQVGNLAEQAEERHRQNQASLTAIHLSISGQGKLCNELRGSIASVNDIALAVQMTQTTHGQRLTEIQEGQSALRQGQITLSQAFTRFERRQEQQAAQLAAIQALQEEANADATQFKATVTKGLQDGQRATAELAQQLAVQHEIQVGAVTDLHKTVREESEKAAQRDQVSSENWAAEQRKLAAQVAANAEQFLVAFAEQQSRTEHLSGRLDRIERNQESQMTLTAEQSKSLEFLCHVARGLPQQEQARRLSSATSSSSISEVDPGVDQQDPCVSSAPKGKSLLCFKSARTTGSMSLRIGGLLDQQKS